MQIGRDLIRLLLNVARIAKDLGSFIVASILPLSMLISDLLCVTSSGKSVCRLAGI